MRARITDPIGPGWTRAASNIAAAALMVVGLLGPWEGAWKGALFCFGAAALFLGPLLLGRRASRDVELALGPGYVDVKGSATVRQRLRARQIVAASAARGAQGLSLALVKSDRNARPVVLDVAGEDEVKQIRDALGIGHYGLGTLVWPTALRGLDRWEFVARAIGGILWACIGLGAVASDSLFTVAIAFGVAMLPICFVLLLTALVSRSAPGPCIALQPTGINVNTVGRAGWRFVPYSSIAGVKDAGDSIELELHGERFPFVIPTPPATFRKRGMSHEERAHVVAQLLSASQRAHGAGEPPPVVGARVADLGKGKDRARTWLDRLDATAQMMAQMPGYRGAGFEEADLWTTLSDHDAPADVRAAAARVLIRVAPDAAPKKIEEVLAAVRDEPARRRIRIAMDPDVELASRELEELETQEAARPGYMRAS